MRRLRYDDHGQRRVTWDHGVVRVRIVGQQVTGGDGAWRSYSIGKEGANGTVGIGYRFVRNVHDRDGNRRGTVFRGGRAYLMKLVGERERPVELGLVKWRGSRRSELQLVVDDLHRIREASRRCEVGNVCDRGRRINEVLASGDLTGNDIEHLNGGITFLEGVEIGQRRRPMAVVEHDIDLDRHSRCFLSIPSREYQ